MITRLEEQFTKYDIEQVSGLTSAYAVRLYELLIAWRSTGKTPIIEIQKFRQKLGVLDTEYKQMNDFKKRVLDIAINQINEKKQTLKLRSNSTKQVVRFQDFPSSLSKNKRQFLKNQYLPNEIKTRLTYSPK